MTHLEKITTSIMSLKDGQSITVKTNYNYLHPFAVITGTLKKARDWFYIQPAGDSHPGASISKGDISEILL